MKSNIHPAYFDDAKVICSCGNSFTTGATVAEIHVELCNKCHPFYTGEQRFIDSASRIEKFEKRKKVAEIHKATVVEKIEKQKSRDNAPKTLREMLLDIK